MKLIVNGSEQEFAVTELIGLLSVLNKQPKGIAIAVNQQIVPRQKWSEFQLAENDNISVFQAIAGG